MDSPWQYSTIHNSTCKVIEEQTLWGQVVCRVWLPNQDAVVRVPRSALQPLHADLKPEIEVGRIAYVAAAAKVADVLEGSGSATDGHVLLAPMESNVIPLPHQVNALSRAISGDRVRYLLADEVGLGKTIEAGLVMRELKLRGLVRRTLVVSPKGIATQWVAEMQNHFNEQFQLVLGDDIGALQRLAPGAGTRNTAWSMFDQVIVSLDSVKPLDKRRGWSAERVAEYNRSRFEDLITDGWDLVIVDEAHRLGGSTDQVARFKLGKGLAEAAPYVLLLSATPHQGKTDAFHRLMSLLDDKAFPDMDSVSRERVAPYVIRTEKRKAIDAEGKPLFKPRRTQMVPVVWESRHNLQKLLYDAVTDYVRKGYNQAQREKKHHIGFLMILMQRLVVSSTRAIGTTLEKRLAALEESEHQASLRLVELENDKDESDTFDEFYDMDGQELLDELLKTHVAALQNESMYVKTLLDAAIRSEHAGPDAKAEALIEWMYKLQAQENEPDLKVLVFTEFVPTQQMLKEFLEARGIPVVTLNGSMDLEERKHAQEAFRQSHRVLVSTDAGGEGLNLQFAHVIINYDIPWNPMRLEQRIGRVDRIGQPKTVQAINFVFEDSVEFRVREVLEQKLAVIFDEFGIDKTGDVLDSAQTGEMFEELFIHAVLHPEESEKLATQTVTRLGRDIRTIRQTNPVFGVVTEPRPEYFSALQNHPLPHWLEQMVLGFLQYKQGIYHKKKNAWDITWPDGSVQKSCVFSTKAIKDPEMTTLLNLEDSRIRGLTRAIPFTAPRQPVPRVAIPGLPAQISGLWGLYEIRLQAGAVLQHAQFLRIPMQRRAYQSVFLSDEGRLFLPTARHIWDSLLTDRVQVWSYSGQEESTSICQQLLDAAEQAGKELFESLIQSHLSSVAREEERGSISFASRRMAIERHGLAEVRHFRLSRCKDEEATWRHELKDAKQVVPEIRPLLLLKISGGSDG